MGGGSFTVGRIAPFKFDGSLTLRGNEAEGVEILFSKGGVVQNDYFTRLRGRLQCSVDMIGVCFATTTIRNSIAITP